MGFLPSSLVARARSTEGKKLIRYSMVSGVAVVVSQFILLITKGLLRWPAWQSNVAAVCISAIPSFYLNRRWAWGKRGRSRLFKEVVPFWGMALLGLVFSTWSATFAESRAESFTSSHAVITVVVMGASLAAFGLLWVGKFMVLNRVLFADRREEAPV